MEALYLVRDVGKAMRSLRIIRSNLQDAMDKISHRPQDHNPMHVPMSFDVEARNF